VRSAARSSSPSCSLLSVFASGMAAAVYASPFFFFFFLEIWKFGYTWWIILMGSYQYFFFSGGILDLLVTHYFRLRSWNNLCSLCNCVYRPGWVFWWRQASSLCPGVSVNYHTSPFGFIELHFIYEICVLCLNNVKINGITA
jgi:hypothetical protein